MMKNNLMNPLRGLALFAVVIGLVFTTSCGEDEDPGPEQNIYEILSSNEDLSTLKGLIDEEGLNTTLSAEGEMTLFAPDNAAMVRLLTTLGLTSFDPVSAEIQTAVLTYHLHTAAKIAAGELTGTLSTAEGELITIKADGTLSTGASTDAAITSSIEATNGYVHIVDAVLVPPSIGAVIVATLGTAAQPILLSSSYSNLAAAIQKADAGKAAEETLVGALISLSGSGVTVFAPVNEALSDETVSSLSAAQLDAIIRGHVIPSNINPLADGTYPTAGGTQVVVAGATVAGPNETAYPVVTASAVSSTNWTVYPLAGVIQ
ncbi:fasciclin domain-containing protein [Marinoscillum pacificum]|uniref:fasciclin domain-containing protein n=1 Tax=Marinoscillum pacificum TaxID=392723 RepID=UPI00215714E6|nr:fasciclin domain-containing protein [Marinoscillum pacificum]